jgi:Zn-dependent membrane protease YugP
MIGWWGASASASAVAAGQMVKVAVPEQSLMVIMVLAGQLLPWRLVFFCFALFLFVLPLDLPVPVALVLVLVLVSVVVNAEMELPTLLLPRMR